MRFCKSPIFRVISILRDVRDVVFSNVPQIAPCNFRGLRDVRHVRDVSPVSSIYTRTHAHTRTHMITDPAQTSRNVPHVPHSSCFPVSNDAGRFEFGCSQTSRTSRTSSPAGCPSPRSVRGRCSGEAHQRERERECPACHPRASAGRRGDAAKRGACSVFKSTGPPWGGAFLFGHREQSVIGTGTKCEFRELI